MDRAISETVDQSITRGSDFLQLDIGHAPTGGRSEWLAHEIRTAISDGRLPIGSRLPASRALAADLHVSRGVVTEAYQRLTEDGELAGHGRAGTVVVAAPLAVAMGSLVSARSSREREGDSESEGPAASSGRATATATGLFGTRPGAEIFESLRAAPAQIDLSPGVPDLGAFPRAAWLRAERHVLTDLPAPALGYGDASGARPLQAAVANWLARTRGIRVQPDEVIVVAGVAQGLGLLSQILRHEGISEVAFEEPGSLGTRQVLQHWGLATPPVAVDPEGLAVGQLRASSAAAVLVTPAHQFPTGVVLDGERRRQLVAWAAEGGLVIEDDYDAEHRYDRPPVPAVRSLLPDRVFYLGSVSKLLAPALRVGWLIAPPRYHDALVTAKRHADLGNAVLPQLVLARLIESGALERQLRFLRRRHRSRRDAMLSAVAEHLPGATVHGRAAGLHLTVTFDAPFADTDLAAAALARGVKVQPLSWHRQLPGPPGLVLGYAASTPGAISQGVAALGEAVKLLG